MALFTDGTISTLEDLRSYESSIYDLASTERIDLSRKLVLAQRELEIELTSKFFRDSHDDLQRVVVTPPLHLWHLFHTLSLAYRDAHHSQLNDRYLAKWREYEKLSKWALTNLLASGVGMVGEPIPKAAPPTLTTAIGSSGAEMYWVRAAWVGQNGEEGCPSEPAVLSAAEGTVPVAVAGEAPAIATGWNVYAGTAIDTTRLQNASPIPLGSIWTMPSTGLEAGRIAASGQSPSSYLRAEQVLRRG
ncbi:MAG TPA: hypothetical protein VLH09_07145 [Bryobacteraceae bacterium]|nr:hypothetical protein [Bryobacteraceae bacterium]